MAADLNLARGLKVCRGCAAYFFCLLSSVFCPLSAAQTLADPTKPPAEIKATPAGQATAAKDSGLQSIIISSTRRAAIINGQMVEVGAMHGEAKLVGVDESGVVLDGSQGRQVLALFPGVEIKRKELPKENGVTHAMQKKKQVKNPARRIGNKEKK